VEPLRAGRSSELIIKFTNPTQHQTTITFLPLDLSSEVIEDSYKKEETAESLLAALSLTEVRLRFVVLIEKEIKVPRLSRDFRKKCL
jgi:hypothetical protein